MGLGRGCDPVSCGGLHEFFFFRCLSEASRTRFGVHLEGDSGGKMAPQIKFRSLSSCKFCSAVFCNHFIDFWRLRTLTIAFPPAREHNFYRIDILGFVVKFNPKIVGFEGPKSMQHRKESQKKRILKTCPFFTSIFLILALILGPKLRPKKVIPRSFFRILGSSGAQEASKRHQEASKSRF